MLCIELKIRKDGSPENRTVYIGDNVVLTLDSVTGNKVKLFFAAPRSVPIHRAETVTPEYAAEVERLARAE